MVAYAVEPQIGDLAPLHLRDWRSRRDGIQQQARTREKSARGAPPRQVGPALEIAAQANASIVDAQHVGAVQGHEARFLEQLSCSFIYGLLILLVR